MKRATKISLLGATATAVVLAFSIPVLAKGHMGEMFEKFDTNADGYIDKAEINAARDARFDEIDANKDGAVTQDELKAFGDRMRAEHGERRKERGEGMFKKLDTDGNGSLSEDEFKAARKMGREHGGRGHGERRMGRMMEHMDANDDGKLTKDEMDSDMADRMMKRLDKDEDGRISKEEVTSMRGKWGRKSHD